MVRSAEWILPAHLTHQKRNMKTRESYSQRVLNAIQREENNLFISALFLRSPNLLRLCSLSVGFSQRWQEESGEWRRVVCYQCTASTSPTEEQEGYLFAGCFLDILFDPEDGGCEFFRNMNVCRTTRRHIPQASTYTKKLPVSHNLRLRMISQWTGNGAEWGYNGLAFASRDWERPRKAPIRHFAQSDSCRINVRSVGLVARMQNKVITHTDHLKMW